MNYRHAYHAGNHTEVFKHSVLCLLLQELRKKTKPFTVIDTHAGAGTYDLRSEMALRTGEALDGIARVIHKTLPTAAAYLSLVRHLNPDELVCYPGSPTIIQNFLRPDDQLIACDLREHDVELLRNRLHWDKRIAIHHRDGYEAIRAFVPPVTRRGLVFIDPPFERADEFNKLAESLNAGIKKWPTGIFAAWYPIKDRLGVSKLRKQYLATNPKTLCCEFLRQAIDGDRLAGSGLLICNPPWTLDQQLRSLCTELLAAFETRDGSYVIDWWIRESG